MVVSDGYEEQTRRLLAETKSEFDAVQAQIRELTEKADKLLRDSQGLETTLDVYLRRTGKQVTTQTNWRELLHDVTTHKTRLEAIAKHKGGEIKISEAANILYTNGFIQTKKRANAYIIVQSNLADMEKTGIFKKIRAGEYKLIGAQQILPSIS